MERSFPILVLIYSDSIIDLTAKSRHWASLLVAEHEIKSNINKFLTFPMSLYCFPLWFATNIWHKVERVKVTAYVLYKSVHRRNDSVKEDCGNVSLLQLIKTDDFLGLFYDQKLNSLPTVTSRFIIRG
ncbi:hypothetical protein LOAG_03148 [Loa loa]|uniref:Uncharacterized protein n=1 Tax=Loa loa TaxID=7209 RepID=A0A1S0U523_LOALO|nr:hypothetical protein LOAG_03148 [Loa loa]EFO25337.1 hypothetical protein LOAG_03148 [Loa loa]